MLSLTKVLVLAYCVQTGSAQCASGFATYTSGTTTCPTGYTDTTPVTTAPATAAPTTTAAPATAAPTTAAPTNDTSADTNSTSANNTRMLFFSFDAPIRRRQLQTAAPNAASCVCQADTTTTVEPTTTTTAADESADSNVTTTTAVPGTKYSVSTTVSVAIAVDLTTLDDTQKRGLAHGLAYGIHASACDGVSAFWDTVSKCMQGEGKDGVEFGMTMRIDTNLVSTQPTASEYINATRRLETTTLQNAGDFQVTAPTAAVAATAQAAIVTAQASGSLAPTAIKSALTSALQARATALGAALNATLDAVASATVNTTVPTVATVTPAPATSAPSSSSGAATAGSMMGAATLLSAWLLF